MFARKFTVNNPNVDVFDSVCYFIETQENVNKCGSNFTCPAYSVIDITININSNDNTKNIVSVFIGKKAIIVHDEATNRKVLYYTNINTVFPVCYFISDFVKDINYDSDTRSEDEKQNDNDRRNSKKNFACLEWNDNEVNELYNYFKDTINEINYVVKSETTDRDNFKKLMVLMSKLNNDFSNLDRYISLFVDMNIEN